MNYLLLSYNEIIYHLIIICYLSCTLLHAFFHNGISMKNSWMGIHFCFSHFRFSPYEKGFAFTNNGKTDQKGSRLAKPDPIYETLFSGANGRLARTVGTQVSVRRESKAEAAILADRPEEEMTFTLLNSFWFMIASLLQQGTDLLPR